MADANSQLPFRIAKQPRKRRFDAPDPPKKPFYIREKCWPKFSSRLAAKLRSDKSGFDVKLLEHSDSTAYKLGPPSNIPDYPHHLEKYGMQVLEAAGFLNHQDEGVSGKIDGQLAFEYWRNTDHNPDLQKRIHPVWRWKEWVNITPHQYSLMTPALLLASAILDDPVTLSFFHALAKPMDSMDTVSHATQGLTGDCKIMKILDVLPEGEDFWTYMKLDLATLSIRDWGFKNDLAVFAYTAKYQNYEGKFENGHKRNTFASYVRLDSAFMRILEYFDAAQNSNDDEYSRIFDDIQTMAGIPASRRAPISHASAIYRTYLILASTLLHELAHAFSYTYVERPNKEDGPCDDPWVPGDRCNELGFAFENFVFGGVVVAPMVNIPPMSDRFARALQDKAAPFGLETSWQWDVWYTNQNRPGRYDPGVMDSDRKIGELSPDNRLYPVPQAWTQWLFSDALWTDHIHRYGLQAVKVPKLPDWEIRVYPGHELGFNGTGEGRWNIGTKREFLQNWE